MIIKRNATRSEVYRGYLLKINNTIGIGVDNNWEKFNLRPHTHSS